MSDQTTTCGNCGATNESTATFCRECGVLLAAYTPPAGSQTAPPPPPAPTAPPPPPPPPRGLTWDDIEAAAARDFGTAERVTDDSVTLPPVETPEPPAEPVDAPPEPAAMPTDEAEAPQDHAPLEAVAAEDSVAQDVAAEEVVAVPETPEAPAEAPSEPPLSTWAGPVDSAPPVPDTQSTRDWLGSPALSTSTTAVRPQTLIMIGAALILGSCLWTTLAAISPLPRGLAFCLGPIGIIVIIVGVVLQANRRPTRRF